MTSPLFTVKVELSTSAPFASSPSWTDITAYVDCDRDGIKFKRGRPDIFNRPDSGDCSFTVNNFDGRFTTTNASGPYYPNLRKNNRIRISVIYSATTYVRYIGYVNEWPNKWEGQDARGEVTCTDIFKLIERKSNSRGNYSEEAFKEIPWAYYPLDETSPSKTFGNVNVNTNTTYATAPLHIVKMVGTQIA